MTTININSDEHHANILNKSYMVIFFYGKTGCSPCELIKPKFKQWALKNPNIKFCYVEAPLFKINRLEGTPTFVAYVNGKPVRIIVGGNESKMNALITELNA